MSSGNAFISGAGALRFESRACEIRRTFANYSPHSDISSKKAVFPGRNDMEMDSALITRLGVMQ